MELLAFVATDGTDLHAPTHAVRFADWDARADKQSTFTATQESVIVNVDAKMAWPPPDGYSVSMHVMVGSTPSTPCGTAGEPTSRKGGSVHDSDNQQRWMEEGDEEEENEIVLFRLSAHQEKGSMMSFLKSGDQFTAIEGM